MERETGLEPVSQASEAGILVRSALYGQQVHGDPKQETFRTWLGKVCVQLMESVILDKNLTRCFLYFPLNV